MATDKRVTVEIDQQKTLTKISVSQSLASFEFQNEKRSGDVRTNPHVFVLTPYEWLIESFERDFSNHSYGFRPGRSAHDAVRAALGIRQSGKRLGSGHRSESFPISPPENVSF
jgi:hypothetical protein